MSWFRSNATCTYVIVFFKHKHHMSPIFHVCMLCMDRLHTKQLNSVHNVLMCDLQSSTQMLDST